MTMRIAILAACAGTLALAQADVAQANYAPASESKTLVRNADVGVEPAIVVAQNTPNPIPGVDIKYSRQPNTPKNTGPEKRGRMSANEASASGALKTKRITKSNIKRQGVKNDRAKPGQSKAGSKAGFAPLRPAEFKR